MTKNTIDELAAAIEELNNRAFEIEHLQQLLNRKIVQLQRYTDARCDVLTKRLNNLQQSGDQLNEQPREPVIKNAVKQHIDEINDQLAQLKTAIAKDFTTVATQPPLAQLIAKAAATQRKFDVTPEKPNADNQTFTFVDESHSRAKQANRERYDEKPNELPYAIKLYQLIQRRNSEAYANEQRRLQRENDKRDSRNHISVQEEQAAASQLRFQIKETAERTEFRVSQLAEKILPEVAGALTPKLPTGEYAKIAATAFAIAEAHIDEEMRRIHAIEIADIEDMANQYAKRQTQ